MTNTETPWPERIDPTIAPPGVVAHHLKKYEFARDRIQGTVLDVACGVGYGTEFLAEVVGMAIGLEIEEAAVRTARQRVRRDNAFYVVGDGQRLPFRDRTIDAVTCFKGIEHFVDPAGHMDEVARVLKPGGSYVVSTPNPSTNPHDHENPFHLHQFDLDHLDDLLGSRFSSVELLGQFRTQTSLHRATQRADFLGIRRVKVLRPVIRKISYLALRTAPTEDATLADFAIEPFTPEAIEYVAVCKASREPADGLWKD